VCGRAVLTSIFAQQKVVELVIFERPRSFLRNFASRLKARHCRDLYLIVSVLLRQPTTQNVEERPTGSGRGEVVPAHRGGLFPCLAVVRTSLERPLLCSVPQSSWNHKTIFSIRHDLLPARTAFSSVNRVYVRMFRFSDIVFSFPSASEMTCAVSGGDVGLHSNFSHVPCSVPPWSSQSSGASEQTQLMVVSGVFTAAKFRLRNDLKTVSDGPLNFMCA